MTDTFRLVDRYHRPDPATVRNRLAARPQGAGIVEHRESAAHYKMRDGLETAVNMALAVEAPLLVTGDPGTGKTQLAWHLGWYLGIEVRAFHVKSTSTARELLYEFDAVGYLQSAYAVREGAAQPAANPQGGSRNHDPRTRFLAPGPLWQAYEDPEPSLLLIDEIDKAPRDFPNDLLHELDQGWFYHPFEREGGEPRRIPEAPGRRPIVVITSNVERRLPGPFLRRCIFHHIELDQELVRDAVETRAGAFPELRTEVRTRALERFWELRAAGLDKPPSTAELLVWLAILNAMQIGERALEGPLAGLPALGSLVKDHDDLERLRRL